MTLQWTISYIVDSKIQRNENINPIIFVNPGKPGKFQNKRYNVYYFFYYVVNFQFPECSLNWEEHVLFHNDH